VAKPKNIGSINATMPSWARIERTGKTFGYDMTPRDMARKAVESGAVAGDRLIGTEMLICGKRFKSDHDFTLYSAPHDDRAYGMWVRDNTRAFG